jgi:hypothetical protein
MPVVYYDGVHLTKLLYGKFVVAGAKVDEVDEMWVRNIGCSKSGIDGTPFLGAHRGHRTAKIYRTEQVVSEWPVPQCASLSVGSHNTPSALALIASPA